ncbi:MAG: NAD(P)/FAD-dependent oxidoreductase [Dehalococcoidia bacterium]
MSSSETGRLFEREYDPTVAIIGGGAAGMMAAASAVEAHPDARITLFERNPRLGAKVIISGGGRCNVTTADGDVRRILSRYPRGSRWLRHAMYSFPPDAVVDWFEGHGVPLKVESDLRVFPVSDNGRDVVGAFEQIFRERAVAVRLRESVAVIARDDAGGFTVQTAGGWAGRFETVVITTGGAAFRHTGSQGDGFRFAAALGHAVTPLYPSLNAYVVREAWAHGLAGVSFADASLRIPARAPGGASHSFRGPFLFTHAGVTGPAVFALCSLAATETYSTERPMPLTINLLPDLTGPAADELLRQRFASMGGRGVANVLDTLLPRSICPVLCARAEIDADTRAARVSRADRQKLAGAITALPLTVVGRRNGEEFVTAGGVQTDEVNPRTMESRLVPGLYFAGEVLNVDGFTGGYNLQAAWATGRLAGLGAVESRSPSAC